MDWVIVCIGITWAVLGVYIIATYIKESGLKGRLSEDYNG